MKWFCWIASAAGLCLVALSGCDDFGSVGTKHADAPAESGAKEKGSQAALAELSPEDRSLAQSQRTCPVTGEPLGGMGTPVKVSVAGQSVFLCCDGCKKKALGDPDKTLAAVEKLKAEAKKAQAGGR